MNAQQYYRAINSNGNSLPYIPVLDGLSNVNVGLSVRKLRSDYTGPCMQVINSTNNILDVGFDSNGYLDEAAILAFFPSSELRVSIWYDQSGNGNNYINSGSFISKYIIKGGSGIYKIGSFASLYSFSAGFGNSGQYLTRASAVTVKSAFIVGQALVGGVAFHYVGWHNNNGLFLHDGLGLVTGGSVRINAPNNGLYVLGGYIGGSPATTYKNGTVVGTASVSDPTLKTLGRVGVDGGGADLSFKGQIQEYILFNDYKNAERAAIESNINSYYSIY